ncbi:MAG TPA: hypothetical protein VG293_03570 [Solirubrobacteraceae bacterium]|nr:hypothetical protein [Solirubrobacteraceae bacterium]
MGGRRRRRLKIPLHSDRPFFIQDRPWREWYWDELEPTQNLIPVRRDLSDLLEPCSSASAPSPECRWSP